MRLFFLISLAINFLFSSNLESLLKEYESSSKTSLKTLDEKMGHVIIYTQNELQKMQYQTLSDILREIPINNINTNRMGINTLSLSGSKSEANGFFRLYINDHEVSSIYIQSPSLGWIDMPLSFIDHIEIYYGESSLTLSNETGLQFIRVYTKNGKKENGSELKLSLSNKSSNSEELTHSVISKNNWSYLVHATNRNSFFQTNYEEENIQNNTNQQYFFFNMNNTDNNIDIGYTKLNKDKFMGYSTDLTPNEGELLSENLFINMSNYFLDDRSLKTSVSFDLNNLEYLEENDQGLFVVPVLDLANMGATMPKHYYQDLQFTKFNAYLSKQFNFSKHTLFSAINFQNKHYDVKNRDVTSFLNTSREIERFHDFDNENVYSVLIQDDYRIKENLHVITNYKINKYNRSGSILNDDTEYLYKIGGVYLPTQNLGFKTFFTKSYMPPSFYNLDFASQYEETLKTQQYKYFTVEGAYIFGDSKVNINYYNVSIDNFIYYSPIGFINVEDNVKSNGYIFDYEYRFSNNEKIKLNYYTSELNQSINNAAKGGYVKYMNRYENIDYFGSLIYKENYTYLDASVKESYNLNLGFTYHYTKNITLGVKGTNLLNKPTQSLATDKSMGINDQKNIAFADYDRAVSFQLRWLF